MPEFFEARSFATLTVRDPRRSARWYTEALGFETVLEVPDPPEGPATAHVRRGHYRDLLLVAAEPGASAGGGREDEGPPGRGVTLNFVVDEDVDALASRAEERGGRVVEGPVERYYDAREVTLEDPDGYRLVFARFRRPQNLAEAAVAMRNARAARRDGPARGGDG